MGVSIRHNKDGKVKLRLKEPKSLDIHQRLLVELYGFLARLTNSSFNQVVLKRLLMSRAITDDVRVPEVPKLKMCALRVSSCPSSRIFTAGSKSLTLVADQLALGSPKGCGIILLSGPHGGREVYRHLGKAPGTVLSHTKLSVCSRCLTFGCARDRHASRSYKS
uniref:Large ribosomal subunit protein uL15/eL18 domain-containing protein n=1 Tax=Equus caballus TaxID=9796 RepID=A0A3Q2HCG6_HORSE